MNPHKLWKDYSLRKEVGSKHIKNILLPLTQALIICKQILCFSPVQCCPRAVDTEGFLGARVLLGRSVLSILITLQALLIALAGCDAWAREQGEGKRSFDNVVTVQLLSVNSEAGQDP